MSFDEARLKTLDLSFVGRSARDILIADLQLLRTHDLAPELNCIHGYPCVHRAGSRSVR